jgi:pteridine reductase
VHYRNSASAAEAAIVEMNAARPGSAAGFQAELQDIEALSILVEKTVDCFGGLDALVNNASSFFPTPVGVIGQDDWENLVGGNLKAPLFLTQAAAPHLKARRGAVVNITDIHAERPLKGFSLYSATKAALVGLTRALALDLAPEIRVNAVSPGPVLWPNDDFFDEAERKRIVAGTLLKRAGCPEDIARAVRFLLNDAPYITGQVINVDGGRSIHME